MTMLILLLFQIRIATKLIEEEDAGWAVFMYLHHAKKQKHVSLFLS